MIYGRSHVFIPIELYTQDCTSLTLIFCLGCSSLLLVAMTLQVCDCSRSPASFFAYTCLKSESGNLSTPALISAILSALRLREASERSGSLSQYQSCCLDNVCKRPASEFCEKYVKNRPCGVLQGKANERRQGRTETWRMSLL
jgi:hypothetical protein